MSETALIRRCDGCGMVTAIDADVTEENRHEMALPGCTVQEVEREAARVAWIESGTCKCGGLSGEDAETLFCMALLRVLDTRQIASVLKVYNEELKPNAPRMLAGVRAATQEGER